MHPLLQNSFGTRPAVRQDDLFPEGIVGMQYASEARRLLLATRRGQLILCDQTGNQLQREGGFANLRFLAWSEVGTFGVAAIKGGRLVCFDADLKIRWEADFTGEILGVAVSLFGSHIAVSSESARTHIVTSDKKEIARFDTPRPLNFLHFVQESPLLIGAAEFGHLCCHELNGAEVWNERTLNNVGNISVSGCGKRIWLSAFNHGIQVLNDRGKQLGSYMLDGIPDRVAGSASRRRIAATTLEQRLFWLNAEGEVSWSCDVSADPVNFLSVSGMADRLFAATESGRVLQLVW